MDNFDAEKANKIVSHMMQNDAFSRWMNIEVIAVDKGYCKVSCTVREEMLNGFRVAHGGIPFSLADSALAFSAATYGRVALAVDNSISFTRKTQAGDRLTAESSCLHLTHKTGLFEVRITNQAGELVAIMKATVYRTSEEFQI